jgi:alanyl-tRNA synthetase
MQVMTSRQIRQQFLDFFASKGHKIIPSAPIVAKSDPTLLFINSGMAPLKDFFLGNQTPPSKRIADTQKCLRVSGKHNDLEDVGFDGYHHTLFEMLGNWSFGDYFKKEAIEWSWELLTDKFKIPKDRIYVSVFMGDEKEKLPFDQEAFNEWKKWIAEDRILPFGKKENFWEMGDQGPCGPCSEIHVDLRSDEDRQKIDGKTLVNNDDPNVIEVWNNVFMQFNRKADGSLDELPAKSVDTGMGFERLCRAVQGVSSNYDTDVFMPLIQFLAEASGKKYEGTYPGINANWSKADVAMRVVADHLRAVSFTIADGELPSNTGAGYVIRRILRRAVRYYYSFLDIKTPIMYRLCPILAAEFHDVFPELQAQVDFVSKVILEEEKSFLRTLESGLKRIETLDFQDNTVSGAQAFELFDTFGFPIDLTELLAREKGWKVDLEGFKAALAEQKTRSRKDAAKQVGDWMVLTDENDVEFVGYDQLEVHSSHLIKYRTVAQKGETQYQVVLNRTPFYPEGGGQVGDKGWMTFGTEKIKVLDTKKENTLVIHLLEKLPSDMNDQTVLCKVDTEKRRLTENNHTATHLLQAALRQVLGTHIQQKGSYLDETALRFDFQHFQKVSEQELQEVERIVNERIRQNIPLEEARSLPIEEAQKSGATMLFGEKYGEKVRMITFDGTYSRELCGGCHVSHTGKIGLFKISSEGAVAAGVRRIEALTAEGAEAFVNDLQQQMSAIRQVIKTKDLPKAIGDLQDENRRLLKEIERMGLEQAQAMRGSLRNSVTSVNGIHFISAAITLQDAGIIKTLAFELERELGGSSVIALGAISSDGKPLLSVKVSDDLVKDKKLNAGTMVRELAQKHLKGGGGGQPSYATAGGTDANGMQEALAAVKSYLN